MQVQQLIQRFRDYSDYDHDPIGGPLSDVQVVDHLNEALYEIGAELGSHTSGISISLIAGVDVYSLVGPSGSRAVIQPIEFLIDGRPIAAFSALEVDVERPGWRNRSGDRVEFVISLDSTTIQVVPRPAASLGAITVIGEVLPMQLLVTEPLSEPSIHPLLHSSVARLAAYNACRPNATESQQVQRLENLRSLALQKVLEVKRRNLLATSADINRRRSIRRLW